MHNEQTSRRGIDYSKTIIDDYNRDADERVAFACRIMVLFMILVAILNAVGIFKINPIALNSAVVFSVFNFLLPTLIYDILKIHATWGRYLVLSLLVFQSGLQYTSDCA